MSANAFASIVAASIFFGLLTIAAVAALVFYSRSERRMQRRLDSSSDIAVADDFDGSRPLLEGMARQGKAIEKLMETQSETGRLLIQAGWRDIRSRTVYYAFQAVTPVVLAGLAIAAAFTVKSKLFNPPFLYVTVLAAVALGILIPIRVLRLFASARRKRIQREVPLFVHLLVMLFDAGLSTRQAFANLVREGGGVLPELGGEIQLVLRQIEAGGDTSEVLRHVGDNLEVGDLTTILGVLRQVDRYGGEIREPLLDSLAVIEERRGLDMREMVNITSGRMTLVMVLFFFPALLIFSAGPAVTAFIRAFSGVAGK
ncbi:MAG: type II secretion system F family protein [Nevskia sp.]|nr:type II secretion system F family protein [Nevskia sp.]